MRKAHRGRVYKDIPLRGLCEQEPAADLATVRDRHCGRDRTVEASSSRLSQILAHSPFQSTNDRDRRLPDGMDTYMRGKVVVVLVLVVMKLSASGATLTNLHLHTCNRGLSILFWYELCSLSVDLSLHVAPR